MSGNRKGSSELRHKSSKLLICACGREVKVDFDTVAVRCAMCLMKVTPLMVSKQAQEKRQRQEGFPQGWRWMKQFVHSDGRVFEKGTENLTLKGTIPATPILSKFERRKAREERKEQKILKLAGKYKEKKRMLADYWMKKNNE